MQLHYQPLQPLLAHATLPVYGAYLGGESVHQLKLTQPGGFVVLGNEANGIEKGVRKRPKGSETISEKGVN